MKIHFSIHYKTVWGQRLLVAGNIPALGNNDIHQALPMSFNFPEEWSAAIDVSEEDAAHLRYHYLLLNESTGDITEEWESGRQVPVYDKTPAHLFCFDQWNAANNLGNVFLTAPFKQVLLNGLHPSALLQYPKKFTHIFRVKAPVLDPRQVVCLIGDCPAFGNWSTQKPLVLQKYGDEWQLMVDLSRCSSAEVHYKYGFYDPDDGVFCGFEDGSDRTALVLNDKKTIVQMNDGFVRTNIAGWRGAGVGLPVFSIRTKKSFGVGDFEDMKLFVDWAAKVGLKLIQVLPLNDTIGTHTDEDVLPYAAITAFALNPLFLHLPSLGKVPAANPLVAEYKALQAELNAAPLIEFLKVVNFKLHYARELYFLQKEKYSKNKEFKKFIADNDYWLMPYAAFCVLRDKFGSSDYRKWEQFAGFNEEAVRSLSAPESEYFDEIQVNYFIQYHLHLQLSDARAYAHKNGVVLKGDIPIGVNRNSADTWAHPEFFHLDKQAGAPPDMFAVKGQNWELPTYNWEAMQKTGFDWWKRRFAQMSQYFDTFRVDHILGFFRIWQIPIDQVEGIMGHLYPSVPVHVNEFGERGIWFDYNRYCKPYITDHILWEVFGDDATWVKANCLQIEDGWVLRLKPPYTSQKNVEVMFVEGLITEKIKWGLFDLISNVLFVEAEGSNRTQFFPRFGMQSLSTFRDLDDNTRNKLDELYVDYYFRRQDAHWYKSGMEKLPALKRATNMLICGEDLGLMTQCVTDVMKETGILSLEVQRAPKTNTIEFFHPSDAPYLSVVTPSTHDMSTVRGWWEEDRGVTQRFYNQQLGHYGEAPYFCEWWISRDILVQHLYSPAMWAVFQIQDLLGISEHLRREDPNEERINVPSNSRFSWRYRLHINLEDLLEADTFNAELRNYIRQAGR
jgi:4-alpha-glucanotransferase